MLQALLALALVIAFLPMFADKIRDKNENRENIAVSIQATQAWNAGRAFVYEGSDGFPNGIKIFEGEDFTNALEPYGLPLGFVPKTPLGQNISLMVSKADKNILAALILSGGKISEFRRAEILTRIGFWGMVVDEDGILRGATGGWAMTDVPNDVIFGASDILIRVPEDEEFSELVQKGAKNPEKNIFHTDLNMDDNNIGGVAGLTASRGKIKNVSAMDFLLDGIEADRKNKNEIESLRASKAWFQGGDGNPLTITRSDLKTGIFQAASVANYGDAPALTAGTVAVRDFNMAAGRTGFAGPANWNIKTGASFTNITLSVERLSISSFLDTSRGQDIFLDETGTDLEYTSGSGIQADIIKTDNIVLRDQISSELLSGGTGAALLEIRPAGTTVLPDALMPDINNDGLKIPATAADNLGKTETCRTIIGRLGGKYNSSSLADNIVCQFVMYNRIEHRIEIKKCLMNGGANCN